MKSSKLICRAAIFVQTVNFKHKLRMELRQPIVSACPVLWMRWENFFLIFLECVVLSPSLYILLIQLFSSISVNSVFHRTPLITVYSTEGLSCYKYS